MSGPSYDVDQVAAAMKLSPLTIERLAQQAGIGRGHGIYRRFQASDVDRIRFARTNPGEPFPDDPGGGSDP